MDVASFAEHICEIYNICDIPSFFLMNRFDLLLYSIPLYDRQFIPSLLIDIYYFHFGVIIN